MLLLRKPAPSAIRDFTEGQSRLELTYSAVRATASQPPAGYDVDRTRIRLGAGRAVFDAAQAALRRWEQFHLGWVELCWPDTPIESGQAVAVLVRVCGLWSLNACRVVYVTREDRRFGYAYGTLPEHAESGEERFLVEWQGDDSVWYDIVAFSRPHQVFSRLGYPLIRKLQKRFARDSAAAMTRAATGVHGLGSAYSAH
jgi:uncharacterized protein (UPF0548 family)